MTLGDFRKYTEKLSDDIELVANLGTVSGEINTFDFINSEKGKTLMLCHSNYGEAHIMGIVRSITFLK